MLILNNLTLGTFDLHIHTTASDGAFSPSEIVEKSYQKGLKTIAITDHDTLSGVNEAKEAAKKFGINIIPGVEISTSYRGKNIDILGYNIQKCSWLHKALEEYRNARIYRAEKIVEKFCRIGFPLTMNDVKKFSENGVYARPHIAKALVEKGYISTVQEVFDHYLADGKPADIPKKELSIEKGLEMIRNAKGISILAHPVYIKEIKEIEKILQLGLDGIEVWHRKHTKKDESIFLDLANRYHLLVTGGSDFHTEEHNLGTFTAK